MHGETLDIYLADSVIFIELIVVKDKRESFERESQC